MRVLCLTAAALLAARAQPPPPPPVAQSCGGELTWSSITFSPPVPVAGKPVNVTAIGRTAAPIADGGSGSITATLWGAPVFTGVINTCSFNIPWTPQTSAVLTPSPRVTRSFLCAGGLNQTLDIDGIVTLTIDGLGNCPLAAGAAGEALSFSIVVPSIAAGIGAIGVIVNSTDGPSLSAGAAYCLNISLNF